jgi:hypothetical protein
MVYTVDTNGLLYIVLISVGLGFLVGLSASLFRSTGMKIKPPKKGLLDIGHLWRDKPGGQLWLQVGSQSGTNLNSFDGEEHQQVVQIVEDLQTWLGKPAHNKSLLSSTGSQDVIPLTTTQEGRAQPFPSSKPEEAAAYPPAPPTMDAAISSPTNVSSRPRIDVIKGLRLAIEGDISGKLGSPSIAAQVNDILQEKLHGTPLAQRGIRLMELPGKGMVVLIGMEQFDSVDAVPYPEIKALIKESVAIWEKKMLG